VAEVSGLIARLAVTAAVGLAANAVDTKAGEAFVATIASNPQLLLGLADIARGAPETGVTVGVIITGIVAVVTRTVAGVGRAGRGAAIVAGSIAVTEVIGIEIAVETVLGQANSPVGPESTRTAAIAGAVLSANCLSRGETVSLGVLAGGCVGAPSGTIADLTVAAVILNIGARNVVFTGARIDGAR